MAVNKVKGLITEQDKRKFLRDVYEESMVNQTQKQIEAFSEEEFYGGPCPYCKEPYAVFLNLGKVKVGSRSFVKGKCDGAPPHIQGCGKEVYIKIKVIQKGDILSGYRFTPDLTYYTIEEIREKYGEETVLNTDIQEVHEVEEQKREAEQKDILEKKKEPPEQQKPPDSRRFIAFKFKS